VECEIREVREIEAIHQVAVVVAAVIDFPNYPSTIHQEQVVVGVVSESIQTTPINSNRHHLDST
jgi:citrate lyase alpha subunit